MTQFDRILQKFPAVKETLFRMSDNLPLILVIPFVLFILFVFFWTFVLSPRKAERIFRGLKVKGYHPVRPDDHQLRNVIERLTPIMFHAYNMSTVTETSPWRVGPAFVRYERGASLYFAHINRSVTRHPPDGSVTSEHQFTIAFFEARALPFSQDVYISGDSYTLDPGYGLSKVDEDAAGSLSALFIFHTRDGRLEPLPPAFQEALRESAPFLSIQSEGLNRKDPFLFYARLRFTPEGWGLISNEFVCDQEKMKVMLKVVDKISRSLG